MRFKYFKWKEVWPFAADCLRDFNVGISWTSPLDDPPSLWNYPLCSYYSGTAGATVSVTCDTSWRHVGRYLIIQIDTAPGSDDVLTMCEVFVYGGTDNGFLLQCRE